jgi:hypothetical protein
VTLSPAPAIFASGGGGAAVTGPWSSLAEQPLYVVEPHALSPRRFSVGEDAMTERLEDFRDQVPVGTTGYIYGGSEVRPLLFHETAQTAFFVTIDALNRFQAYDFIGANSYVVPTIGLWFQAMESYISTAHKVAQLDANLRGTTPALESKTLPSKFAAIEEHFGAALPGPDKPRLAFIEFCTLRNMLFHDLIGVKRPEFHHTFFAPAVENINEVDLFQSLIIAVDVFTYFRRLFPAADLMPSIAIQGAQEKLDVLTEEILFPAFTDLLAAKGLTTDLSLVLGSNEIQAEAPTPLLICIKTESDANAPVQISPKRQKVAWEYFNQASAKRPVDEDKFEIPRYTRA